MNIINLEVEFIGGGLYKTTITNVLGGFSLEELAGESFQSFLHFHLVDVVDYGDDELIFEEDLDEGYVFLTIEKFIADDEFYYNVVKSYYQPLI
jgi:hypothetical protein